VTTKPKLFYLNMSLEIISFAFKQAPYELCILCRTIVMIIFSGNGMPKKKLKKIYTPAPQKLHDIGC
jgi:hypothetical protein